MSQTRDVLGHMSIDTAIRRRKCYRSAKHQVYPGENFLLIRESYTLGFKNYCKQCAREIIVAADKKLTELTHKLK